MQKDRSADGLRGMASLSVVLHHALLAFFPVSMLGFFPSVAFPDARDGAIEVFASLPVLSTLWNGRLAVCIFFVLSGYVLTSKFVMTGESAHVRAQAARRYIRLGLPIFASAMFACALWLLGAYHIEDAAKISRSAWLGAVRPIGIGWEEAIREGVYGAILMGQTKVNNVLWTMHIEFFGSMLIFAYCVLGKGWEHIAAILYLAIVYSVAPEEWPYYCAFLIGFFIAKAKEPESSSIPVISVVVGVLLAHIPSGAGMWDVLPLSFSEDMRFMIASVAGGSFIVYGVRFGALRGVLHSRIAQFLGRISFPLYLVHLPIFLSLGCWTFVSIFNHGYHYGIAGLGSFLTTLLVAIPAAWLFERWVDSPAIAFSHSVFKTNKGVPPIDERHPCITASEPPLS